jgi:hypothetical protein
VSDEFEDRGVGEAPGLSAAAARDGAAVGLPDVDERAGERALAGAVDADQADVLARADVDGDALEDRL